MKYGLGAILCAASVLAIGSAAHATAVYGSLGNFDAVNDTGHEAHGFEIDIEDSSYDHTKLLSVFGLDRNFGVPAASVERYGAPTITDVAGYGVRIIYKASFSGSAWSVGTSSGTYTNPGDSCWSLGNASYPNVSCDHFGVGTYGTPLHVAYSWLVDPGNTGTLTAIGNNIPHVAFTPTPAPTPSPGVPNPVQGVMAVIQAPAPEGGMMFGEAYWVKVYSINAHDVVHLDQLVKGNAAVPGNAEVETEWTILQAGGAENELAKELGLGAGDKGIVRRYEFYKYTGAYNPDGSGEVMCDGAAAPSHACDNPFGDGSVAGINDLGHFVGDQIAGYNANQPAPVAGGVPEPATWAMLLAGFGLTGASLRGRRKARFATPAA